MSIGSDPGNFGWTTCSSYVVVVFAVGVIVKQSGEKFWLHLMAVCNVVKLLLEVCNYFWNRDRAKIELGNYLLTFLTTTTTKILPCQTKLLIQDCSSIWHRKRRSFFSKWVYYLMGHTRHLFLQLMCSILTFTDNLIRNEDLCQLSHSCPWVYCLLGTQTLRFIRLGIVAPIGPYTWVRAPVMHMMW